MRHIPVLPIEVISALNLKAGAKVIDCTLGDAGHSEKILKVIGPKGMLLGIDADVEAILSAKRILYRFGEQVIYVRDNFENLKKIALENGFESVQGILLDLGWSTPQFNDRGRGFSFELDERLDMRYFNNPNDADPMTAEKILKEYSMEDLSDVFRTLGEEKFYKEIAIAVCKSRKEKPLTTTKEFSELVLKVYREKLKTDKEIPWIGGIHPATKAFQALRIEVNNELGVIKDVLPQAVELLATGGRLVVISFHSLEDRIIKRYFQSLVGKGFNIITKKPLTSGVEELKNNPRSRSAKLRVIEKI